MNVIATSIIRALIILAVGIAIGKFIHAGGSWRQITEGGSEWLIWMEAV